MVRRILFAGLLLGPLVVVLHYVADLDETVEFVLAALALIPLAWLIGEATEHAAEHTGPGIGGFLNATFGNAPELIIALLAVNQGLTEVVRGSLTGSVVGNLLLVLGFSLAAGPRGELDRWSSFMSFGAIALAILLFLIPAIPSWDGNPDRDLRARGECDLRGELDLPAGCDDDGAAVLGRVADDRDDHRGDEELRQADLVGEDLERADEDLRHERGHDGRAGEDDEREPQ